MADNGINLHYKFTYRNILKNMSICIIHQLIYVAPQKLVNSGQILNAVHHSKFLLVLHTLNLFIVTSVLKSRLEFEIPFELFITGYLFSEYISFLLEYQEKFRASSSNRGPTRQRFAFSFISGGNRRSRNTKNKEFTKVYR
mgnify:CR=1 FL=1